MLTVFERKKLSGKARKRLEGKHFEAFSPGEGLLLIANTSL